MLNRFHFSVQFSHSVMSDSLRPHESQHARPPCSSPTPGVHSDSRSQKIKSDTVSPVSPSICHEVMGPDAIILVF